MQEVWLPVVGYEGLYEVSDQGRVRSLDRTVAHNLGAQAFRRIKGRTLSPGRASNGYLTVMLSRDGKKRSFTLHSIVAAAFLGPRPKGMEVLHGSPERTDNRAANLRYGTNAENKADMLRDDTHTRGERSVHAKLTERQVLEIRRRAKEEKYGAIAQMARELRVSDNTLRDIVNRRTWAWLEP